MDRLAASNEGQPAVHPDVVYILFGREVGESGTPHLQGTICLRSRKYRSQVKQIIGHNPHLEVTQNLARSIEYCKKDDPDPIEIGNPPRQPTHPKGKNATKTVKKPKTKNMELKMEMTKKPDKVRDLEGVWVRAPKFDANDGVRWILM